MDDIDEIKAALREISLRSPTPWHTDFHAPWNIEDAKGRDVALVQMQVGDPRQGQPHRTALARFLSAAPDAIAYLLEQLEEARRGRAAWIPAAERMPPEDQWVLIAHRKGPVFRAYSVGAEWRLGDLGNTRLALSDVTHWMPMPAPPEVPRG